MLWMVAVIGMMVLVGGISVVLWLAPPADEPVAEAPRPVEKPSAFFVAETRTEVQMEILLARLEQHVRQERAAVELFHDEPSAATLRGNTSSPLAN